MAVMVMRGIVRLDGGRAKTDSQLIREMLDDEREPPGLGDLGSFPPHGGKRATGAERTMEVCHRSRRSTQMRMEA